MHRATIYRREDGTDRFGDPIEEYQPLAANVPCRVTVSSLGGGFANIGGERLSEYSHVIMEDRRVYLPAGTDVVEDDEIDAETLEGAEVIPRSGINFVRRIFDGNGVEHHVEVLLKVWRKGEPSG